MAEVLLLAWAQFATIAWWIAYSDARWHAARAAGYKARAAEWEENAWRAVGGRPDSVKRPDGD